MFITLTQDNNIVILNTDKIVAIYPYYGGSMICGWGENQSMIVKESIADILKKINGKT